MVKEKLQRIGQVMLIPISVITVASFLMGLGSVMSSTTTLTALGLQDTITKGSFWYDFFSVMNASGSLVFSNLPVLFAVGSAFGLADKEKGWAAFSGVVAFIAMHTIIQTLLSAHGMTPDTTTLDYFESQGMNHTDALRTASLYTKELGIFTYRMSIFGGLIAGITTSWFHNRLWDVKLPQVLSFFAGTRTVPIVMLVIGALLGWVFYYAWPPLGYGVSDLSLFIGNSGLLGTAVWAYLDRALVPFGLHHLLTQPLRYTELGGTAVIDGVAYYGTTNIAMAQLASPTADKILVRGYYSGRMFINFGGFQGACLAMYLAAPKDKRKATAGILIPCALTVMLFGVTEPLEFTFLFVAPWLFYLVHAPLTALAFVLAEASQVSTFGGCIKDLLPFLLQPQKLNLWPMLWGCPLFFALYFLSFYFLILKFDVKTPGREDDGEIKLHTKKEYLAKGEAKKAEGGASDAQSGLLPEPNGVIPAGTELADRIIAGLGGAENIEVAENCISRLRCRVKDPAKVVDDDYWRSELEAKGVVHQGNSLQIIYGTQVTMIAADVRGRLDLD